MAKGAQKELQQLIDQALAQGWKLTRSKQHFVLLSPDGTTIVTVGKTPSDHRALKNIRGMLRRGGLDC